MCDLCSKYYTCDKLCDLILKELNKDLNSFDSVFNNSREFILTNEDLDLILYSNSLTNNEYSRLSNLIIAILTPRQKEILKQFSKGKNQVELANIFNVSQASISQSIKAIKKEIYSQMKLVIEI